METDRYTATSFESPHNNVHNSVGCSNGTMYDLNWSAFDPAFMLHHANVDRLIALWQAIYPNSSIFNVVDYAGALYGTAAGNVSADTPLKPFHDPPGAQDGAGGFHTSRSVRDVAVLGYSYPELQAPRGNGTDGNGTAAAPPLTPDELAEHVRFRVNSLYSSVPTTSENVTEARRMRLLVRRPEADDNKLHVLRRPAATRKTWSVAISVDRAEVPLPATIGCFLSDDDSGRREQAGRMSLLAIPAVGVTHSTIPLDGALGAIAGDVFDLGDAGEVSSYLNRTLKFEVLQVSRLLGSQFRTLRQAILILGRFELIVTYTGRWNTHRKSGIDPESAVYRAGPRLHAAGERCGLPHVWGSEHPNDGQDSWEVDFVGLV